MEVILCIHRILSWMITHKWVPVWDSLTTLEEVCSGCEGIFCGSPVHCWPHLWNRLLPGQSICHREVCFGTQHPRGPSALPGHCLSPQCLLRHPYGRREHLRHPTQPQPNHWDNQLLQWNLKMVSNMFCECDNEWMTKPHKQCTDGSRSSVCCTFSNGGHPNFGF